MKNVDFLKPISFISVIGSKLSNQNALLLNEEIIHLQSKNNNYLFSRLNAGGIYLKLGLVDPAFIRTRRLFGAWRLFISVFFFSTGGLLN